MLLVFTANQKSMGISIKINRYYVRVPGDCGGVRSWGWNVKYPCAAILYSNQVTNLLVKLVKIFLVKGITACMEFPFQLLTASTSVKMHGIKYCS